MLYLQAVENRGGRQLGTLLYLGKICNKVQQAISAPVAHG
jgi:hypothetical protein